MKSPPSLRKVFVQHVLYSWVCAHPPCAPNFARVQSPSFCRRRSGQRGRSGRAVARLRIPLHMRAKSRHAEFHLISTHFIPLNTQPSTIRLRCTESVNNATQVLALTSHNGDCGVYVVNLPLRSYVPNKRGVCPHLIDVIS